MKRVALLLAMAASLCACVPDAWLKRQLGMESDVREFGPGFVPPLSGETNEPVHGIGGNGGGVHRTPLIIVHGMTGRAYPLKPMREYFLSQGYTEDEVWVLGYGWGSGYYWDTTPPSSATLERFVDAVLDYLSKKEGRPIRQVDMIGHSLGVMVVRHWVKETNSFHKLRSYVAVAGLNHIDAEVPLERPDGRGANRGVFATLATGSPWLQALNRGGDVPGPTRYMTLYDGTGWSDMFYAPPRQDAPRLEGADNVAYNREHGTTYDHVELMFKQPFWTLMGEWLNKAHEPLPDAQPPQMVQDGAMVKPDPEDARLHCTTGVEYPTAVTRSSETLDLHDGLLHTCYARSNRTGLSSPLGRFKYKEGPARSEPLTLTASVPGGAYEQSQDVKLVASDPDAFIVYSTITADVNTGSPLYSEDLGVYMTSPLTLTARAYAPDGRISDTLSIRYNISLEMLDANRTLQRQVDPSTPLDFADQRHAGR